MANAVPKMQPSKRMLAAYDDAMTTQRSLRATHRTIVAEQSEIALKKFQSVKDLGVRLDACLGIAPRVIPDGPRTGGSDRPAILSILRARGNARSERSERSD